MYLHQNQPEICPPVRRTEVMQAFERLVEIDPEAAKRLLGDLSGTSGSTRKRQRASGPTQFDRIVELFSTNGGAWLTINEIAESLGIPRTSVRGVVYKMHPDQFQRRARGQSRLVEFRINDESQQSEGESVTEDTQEKTGSELLPAIS